MCNYNIDFIVLFKELFFNMIWDDLIKLILRDLMIDLIFYDRMIFYNLYFYRNFQFLYDLILI